MRIFNINLGIYSLKACRICCCRSWPSANPPTRNRWVTHRTSGSDSTHEICWIYTMYDLESTQRSTQKHCEKNFVKNKKCSQKPCEHSFFFLQKIWNDNFKQILCYNDEVFYHKIALNSRNNKPSSLLSAVCAIFSIFVGYKSTRQNTYPFQ